MKKLIFILIAIFAVLFSSCSGAKYRKSLIEADSLCSTNPREAIMVLGRMKQEMTEASEQERMYYRLLQIKAADKAYIRHTSDSIILELVEYYETEGDKKLLSEAYYYAGSTYRDLNDAPRALEYYQKAMELISNGHIMGNLYFQIGNLLLNQTFYNQAIDMYQKAKMYYIAQNDRVNTVHTLRNLAYTYNKIGEIDSCLTYYQTAYELAKEINDINIQREITAQMASFYIEKKDFVKAKKYLQPMLNGCDSLNLSPIYAMALKTYINTAQYDSAYFYAKELLKNGTIYAKQTATRYLTELALWKKDYTNADKYLKMFNRYTDSVKIITATESISRMNSLYNYNLREKENLRLKTENANRKLSLTVSTFVVFILLAAFITYIYISRQKQKRQIERLKKFRKDLFEQSEEYISQNKKKIKDIEQELERTSKENLMLMERIKQQRADLILANENAIRKQEKNESSRMRIAATEIYETIQEHIRDEKIINAKEWEILEDVINNEITDFKGNLHLYHDISQHEYHICMLIRLGISPKDMGILLGCTTSAVSKARKRLHEKFFSNEGTPKDFDDFVNSL